MFIHSSDVDFYAATCEPPLNMRGTYFNLYLIRRTVRAVMNAMIRSAYEEMNPLSQFRVNQHGC